MRCRVAAARESRKSCKPHNAALLTRRIRIYSRTFRSRHCTGLSTTVSAITANSSAASNVAPNINTLIPAYDHPSVGTGILGPISTLDSGESTRYIV